MLTDSHPENNMIGTCMPFCKFYFTPTEYVYYIPFVCLKHKHFYFFMKKLPMYLIWKWPQKLRTKHYTPSN